MKILHVTQGYYPAIGGTELMMQRVSEELVSQFGDQVTVFTTNCYSGDAFYSPHLPRMATGWEKINEVNVRRFPVYSWISRLFYPFRPQERVLKFPGIQYLRAMYNGPIIPGLSKAIKEHQPDLIVASSFPLLHMFTALKAAKKINIPCVLMGGLHPLDEWGFQRPMIYQAINEADQYIANTNYEADFIIRKGVSPEKINVIGVGVDLSAFEAVDPEQAKERLGFGNHPVVGFIGQIGGHKGVDTFVRAMPLVWKVIPDVKVLIAGARTLFAESLEQSIALLPEEEQANLVFHYDFANSEKPELFSALDVFAYPSGFESFGIAFLEAWAAKKPVIGCRRGAVPWVINAGQDGLLVDFQDEIMLAEAVITLLRNPKWAKYLGNSGYKKVLSRYTWPEIARRFREVYLKASNFSPQ